MKTIERVIGKFYSDAIIIRKQEFPISDNHILCVRDFEYVLKLMKSQKQKLDNKY